MLKDRLRKLRLAKGLSQERLAKLSGVTQATLSDIETGRQAGMHADTLAALAHALDEDANYIRTGRRGGASEGGIPDELIELYERLTPAHRLLWREMGQLLIDGNQSARDVQHALGGTGNNYGAAKEALKIILELVETHGLDEAARALADNTGSAQQPGPGRRGRNREKT
jgi:transcriptional regulator with XRE-family HTH domain